MNSKLVDAITSLAQFAARHVDSQFGTDLQHCIACEKMKLDLRAGESFWKATLKRMRGEYDEY